MNRYISYGYKLQNGSIVIDNAEAKAVKSIFEMYTQGNSLLSVAQELQSKEMPYSDGKARWNKNNVARIIANERYIGADKYPAILSTEEFERAQTVYRAKAEKWATSTNNPSGILWKRLRCAECSGRLLRIGGVLMAKGIAQLRCENAKCDGGMDIEISDLHESILAAMTPEQPVPSAYAYEPSQEVIRMNNEINRCIESPGDPGEARRLILQGAAARYKCFPDEPIKTEYKASDRPSEIDWNHFKRAVSLISIGKDRAITVRYIKENAAP